MSVDLWTKMALTLIAVSLAVIAWKLPFADLGHAQTGTCGGSSSAPCYIANNGDDPRTTKQRIIGSLILVKLPIDAPRLNSLRL